MSPAALPTTPGRLLAARSRSMSWAVETLALGPSSQVMLSAASPCFAAQVWSPTTATRSSSTTTWRTPGTVIAWLSSTRTTLPPTTGECAIIANFTPSGRASMP